MIAPPTDQQYGCPKCGATGPDNAWMCESQTATECPMKDYPTIEDGIKAHQAVAVMGSFLGL